mgnify:CR=1 FL=1
MSAEAHIAELLPAYALDCLDEDELIAVSEHLAVCADCRADLRAYDATIGRLALAAPDVAPPPELKIRLLERIQPPSGRSIVQPRSTWWASWLASMRRTTPLWVAAALVLIGFLGLSNLWLWQRLNQLETAQPSSGVWRTIILSGTEVVPAASGLIVISLDGHHGTLVVDQLPPLAENQQYQLWLIEAEAGQRDNGGVFSVSEEGYGSLWIDSAAPLSNYTGFGITIEPAGGSSGPTGPKVLGGSL